MSFKVIKWDKKLDELLATLSSELDSNLVNELNDIANRVSYDVYLQNDLDLHIRYKRALLLELLKVVSTYVR